MYCTVMHLKEYLCSKKYIFKNKVEKVFKKPNNLLEAYAAAHHHRMWTYSM